MRIIKKAKKFGFILFSLSLVSCASYQHKVSGARAKMQSGSASQAAAELEPLANKEGDDQLVYLLDYASMLQHAGRFKESAEAFGRAEKIADVQDYHSLSNIASSLALSEGMIQYKGDDYEKLLIHAVNAVNYLEMNDLEGALVEVRKINTKLQKYRLESKRDYEQNPFAYYLSAMIWEADRMWDDAYIAYKNAYDLIPDYQPLREDLIRSSQRAQRTDELEKWKRAFPEVKVKPEWKDKSMGEVVLIYQQGWGPRKRPRPENPRFPMLVRSPAQTQSAKLIVVNTGQEAITDRVFDVERIAIKTLNDDYGRIVASRLAGIATKAVIAEQLRRDNELVGELAWIAMNIADQADLRQWSTLPETFQVARVMVPAGKYRIRAQGLDHGNGPTSEEMPEREVEVKPGRKTFVGWRSVY